MRCMCRHYTLALLLLHPQVSSFYNAKAATAKRAAPKTDVAASSGMAAAAFFVALLALPLAVELGPVGFEPEWVDVAVAFEVLLPYGAVELLPVVVLNW